MINIKLFNQNIPQGESIKFLGLIFDRTMNFNKCVEDVHKKCHKRLNIIKILTHKSWKLTSVTLRNIYYSLIRSVIDYAAVIFDLLSETKKKDFRSIQYHALRISYRKPLKYSHKELLQKVDILDERVRKLNEKYLQNAYFYENELIMDIIKKYSNWYTNNKETKHKTILCQYRDTIKILLDTNFF